MSSMTDNISTLCDVVQGIPVVCDLFTRHANYIFKFDDNLDDLKIALEDLIAKRNDLIRQVDASEIKGQRQGDQLERWRLRVQAVVTNTNLLVGEASVVQQRLSTYGNCSTNIFSAYSSGKKICEKLSEIREILSEFCYKPVTRQATLCRVIKEPVQKTVGLDTTLRETWEIFMRDNVTLLGIHGRGGVGKTTLLALINNKFKDEEGFDVVVWVKVSEDVDIAQIQDEIGKRLGLYDEDWSKKSQREKRCDIIRVIKTKNRFVLLLDDLRKVVSLVNIGISVKPGKCKIVFTTGSKSLCKSMGANEVIEVKPLTEEDALVLLKQKAGRETLDGEMLEHANIIVKKCLGLPLVLNVIGRHLLSETTADQWNHVLHTWFMGIDEDIFPVLRISYDTLEDDSKSCLKYCALFPEECRIKGNELVEYWIGEGIINEENGREVATNRGYTIINTLVGAGLLVLDGEPNQEIVYMHGLIHECKQKVYMQGLIRQMALQLVVESGEKFFVKTSAGLRNLPRIKDLKIVTKMSLMNNEFKSIPDSSQFSNPDRLVTLFFQNNKLEDIVGIQVLSTLVVLDLSRNLGITELPGDISKLVSLRYLNLLGTRINNLQGILELIQLIHLDLESTSDLRDIHLISGLLKLQVLRLYRSAHLRHELLENLERLEDLKLLTITVEEDFEVLKAFLGSNLAWRTQGLYLDRLKVSGVSGKSFAATFGELGSLSKLGMTDCDIIESETEWEDNRRNKYPPSTPSSITPRNIWFKNLSAVEIYSCVCLTDLTWLIYAANLESLSVKNSPNVEEVISKEKASDEVEPFQKLQVLDLDHLDKLKRIYWKPLSFPMLQKVHITNCLDLPLDSIKDHSHDLEKNLEALENKVETLNGIINELLRRVSKEKDRGLQTLHDVEKWISMAEETESKASSLLDKSISDCSQISEDYRETVCKMLKEVEDLSSKGVFKDVVDRSLISPVKKMLPLKSIVSREMLLEKAWKCLAGNECGTLGLYGIAGVGKTTLLTRIKNKFIKDGDASSLVIFVLVEPEEEVESIQHEIGKRLGLYMGGKSKELKYEIYRFLERKRYVLLLDGVQRKLDLAEIGVPLPSSENGCKVIFTSHYREACGSKWVDAVEEVKCLSPEESWDMFQEIVGKPTLKSHPDIPQLARLVARKCGGLPIVLSLIGKGMSRKRTAREWHHAIHLLVSSTTEFSGMEAPVLKFTYDNLPGEDIKACFLYCALFPRNCDISKQDLVDCWIAEGMIEGEDREIAEIKSYEMITDLVLMGLLIDDECGYGIKMHRMVREMAFLIASQKENFVASKGIHQMPEVNDWSIVRRMSVTCTQVNKISYSPDYCPQLTTLFLHNLKWVSGDFFRWMTSLVVLNLSRNRELSELPEEVSSLVSLRLLNLSWTWIKRLPLGLRELKSLIHLDLDYTPLLVDVDVISYLLNLQVLRLFQSVPLDLSLLEDIQLLKSLKDLNLTVGEVDVLKQLLSIHQLASCIRYLHFTRITINDEGTLLLNSMLSLRELNILMCDIPAITINWRSTIQRERVHFGNTPLLHNLRTVTLSCCKGLRDLTWLILAPNLADLRLLDCQHIEHIINQEKATADISEQPFQNLTRLSLDSLPRLESIYWTPLPFPVLKYLYIKGCPKLRTLPFNSNTAKGNQVLSDIEQELIKEVEWKYEATKQHFSELYDRDFPKMAEDEKTHGFASPALQASSSKEASSLLAHDPKKIIIADAAHVLDLSSSSATTTTPISSGTCTSVLSQQLKPQHKSSSSSSKLCQVEGCQKRARGASGRCISHGGGRRCQKHGCHKGAEGQTLFCKAHGGGRRCEFLGCTKSAEGRTYFCIAHGGGRRCSHEDCTRAARGRSGLCIRHGGGKRCQTESCTKSAEGLSGLCISHGGGRRCQSSGCTKGAQGSTMFCKAHGGGERCTHPGCTKGAEGSTPFCKGHAGGKRCAVPECTKSARGTDFCVRHGGGKRCKSEGCVKSAQGSTDFCKAHGGGKRCAWGHPETEYAGQSSSGPCTSFARGKTGLCALHTSLVQDNRVHGGITVTSQSKEPRQSSSETENEEEFSGSESSSETENEEDFSGSESSIVTENEEEFSFSKT
ncbi:hypothetical protein IGI04_034183 [Brassica rapa subsp. trilocularis]|uniref:AAA+ ATPase domain-containing protein n=1 Tax=Brassica rapa subsp. trilocularis TaxID=1813537 RepID=A0ABQ7L800_BRACM|nr:hypothetical protein IGI04_034183 [Brassica rapa subsp. trilocularis]